MALQPPGESEWLEFNDAFVKPLGPDGESVVLGTNVGAADGDEPKLKSVQPEPEASADGEASGRTDAPAKPSSSPAVPVPQAEAEAPPSVPATCGGDVDGPDAVPKPGKQLPRAAGLGKGAKATGTRGNAYMLLYRRRGAVGSLARALDVPERIRKPVDIENEAARRLMQAYAVRQKVVELAVHRDPSVPPDAELARNAAQAASADGVGATADAAGPKLVFLDLPKSMTLRAATDAVRCPAPCRAVLRLPVAMDPARAVPLLNASLTYFPLTLPGVRRDGPACPALHMRAS